MSNLLELEEIASSLAGTFDLAQLQPVKSDLAIASLEEATSLLGRWQQESEEDVSHISNGLKNIEAIVSQISKAELGMLIQYIEAFKIAINGLYQRKTQLDSRNANANALHEAYRQRVLEEAGFSSYEEFRAKHDSTYKERSGLYRRFLGRFRFRNEIRSLDSQINKLSKISSDFYTFQHSKRYSYRDGIMADIGYNEKYQLERSLRLPAEFFNSIASRLFNAYDALKHDILKKSSQVTLSPQVLDALNNEFVEVVGKRKILEHLRYSQSLGEYGRQDVEVLSNETLVRTALSVFRGILDQTGYTYNPGWGAPAEVEERAKVLREKIDALPRELQEIRYFAEPHTRGNKTSDEVFQQIADFIAQAPADAERRELYNSLFNTINHLMSALPQAANDGSSDQTSSVRSNLEYRLRQVKREYEELAKKDIASKIDIERYNVFRQNEGIRKIFGQDVLDSFHEYLGNSIWDRLLVTPQHTDESVDLGYKALQFNDIKFTPYLIFNFWREPGHSGETPFLSIHSKSEDTIGAKFITTLTAEQLRAIEQLNVPGLMDLIKTVREHPTDFRKSMIKRGEEYVDNPVHKNIEEAITKMCIHYMENGTPKERYFAMSYAPSFDYMRKWTNEDDKRDTLINSIARALGLEEKAPLFQKYFALFSGRLSVTTRRSTHIPEIAQDMQTLSNYLAKLDDLIKNASHPTALHEEMQGINSFLDHRDKIEIRSNKAIGYLRAFDSPLVQGYLSSPEFGNVFRDRIRTIKHSLFNNEDEPKDAESAVLTDLNSLNRFIDETSKVISSSRVYSTLKAEQGRMLAKLAVWSEPTTNWSYLIPYLAALDHEGTAKKFELFDEWRKDIVQHLAYTAFSRCEELVVPLVRRVVEKEKSPNKMSLVSSAVRSIIPEMVDYLVTTFNYQPNAAYNVLSRLSLVLPIVDGKFNQDVLDILGEAKPFSSHELSDDVRNAISSSGFENDADVAKYLALNAYQGKTVSTKSLSDFVKSKQQIIRYEAELQTLLALANSGNFDEKTRRRISLLEKQLADRQGNISLAVRNQQTNALCAAMNNLIERTLESIVGGTYQIDMIDEDITNAILVYSNITDNKQLLAALIKDTLEGEPLRVYDSEPNRNAISKYRSMGVNMDKWMSGITRTYTPQKNEDVAKAKEEQMQFHRQEALKIFRDIGYNIEEGNIFEEYEKIKNREDIGAGVKADLLTQLHAIKSIESAIYNSRVGEIIIHKETKPMKVLEMGNVVSNSCLALGRGKTYSAVANAADVNKAVLYAIMQGEIIGRKLIALNEDGEIVQFRTYNNRLDLNLDLLFGRYLVDLSQETSAKLGNNGTVPTIMSQRWYNDGIVPFNSVPNNRQLVGASRTG